MISTYIVVTSITSCNLESSGKWWLLFIPCTQGMTLGILWFYSLNKRIPMCSLKSQVYGIFKLGFVKNSQLSGTTWCHLASRHHGINTADLYTCKSAAFLGVGGWPNFATKGGTVARDWFLFFSFFGLNIMKQWSCTPAEHGKTSFFLVVFFSPLDSSI